MMRFHLEFTVALPERITTKCSRVLTVVSLAALMLVGRVAYSQKNPPQPKTMDIGVARVDITPETPIRLAGYAARTKSESDGVIHRLSAKALAFGSDAQGLSVFITVDLVGIPGHITAQLAERLSSKIGIDPAQLAISSSHTHGGPEVGNLVNILQARGETFSDSLIARDQMVHIAQYLDQLSKKLEDVALAAIKDRKPSLLAWGQGQVRFAKNRRTEGGPVDPTLPLLRVTDPQGKLRALLVNYACHGTTLEGAENKIHNDWIGEAQKLIEAKYPGVTAMVAIGCGADANPNPRGKMEHATAHGQQISNHVETVLASQLIALSEPPVGRMKWIKLPYAKVPTVAELIKQSEEKSIKGYYARLSLERIARGIAIPKELTYPVQTWTFGDDLAMINLAGEVVVDYSVRLKDELGAEKLWVNAYTNDVPCYIASRRVIREGGYEAESSMYYYDKPSPFVEEVEDIIVAAVHDLLPASYKVKREETNQPERILSEANQVVHLKAEKARAIGPQIKYMKEWKAFGWFSEEDRVEWDVQIKAKRKYDVYMEWSVSDGSAGKPFVFETGKQKLNGTIGKTGSWFTYKTEKIGRVQLAAGNHTVVLRPGAEAKKGMLMDLRAIKLIPVK